MKNLKSGFHVPKRLFLFASMKHRSRGNKIQKQSPEVLYKKKCSQKFLKIHRKTPVPEYLFYQKRDSGTRAFL